MQATIGFVTGPRADELVRLHRKIPVRRYRSLMGHWMSRWFRAPRPAIQDHPVPCPGNALGAKGAGEAGTTGALPALANAVLDALRPDGVEQLDFPFTPERVWNALQAH